MAYDPRLKGYCPDNSFDLSDDSYTVEEIVESIARDLQREMVWDWENKLGDIENASEDV